jgi:large subunit ribosomal protein L19
MLQCRDVMAFTISPVDVEARKKMDLRSGDTVRVHQKIEEKGKTRIQAFEGLVLARKHGTEAGGTFTVRRVSSGVGVEKVFPLYSPMIDKIEIVKRATMRRAKLYFLRDKVAREARRMLRRTVLINKNAAPVVTGLEEDQTPIEVASPTAEEAAAAEQV